MIPPIFVISLARAAERRADITRRLEADGLQYEIVDAVDGRELNRADYADRLEQYDSKEGSCFRLCDNKHQHDKPLNSGEIGCYLSHYNLWQRIVAERIPAAMVLEDDAVWNADFAAVVAKAAACDWEWDLIHFCSAKKKRVNRVMQPLYRHFNLVQLMNNSTGTVAYLISLSAAEKLVKHCYLIHNTADTVWMDYWNWKGRVYSVIPYPVSPGDSPSIISDSGVYPRDEKAAKIGFCGEVKHFLIQKKYWAINRFYRFWIRPKRK